jgi:hypothetical protein
MRYGRAFNTHGKGESFTEFYSTTEDNLSVDGRTILKCMLKRNIARVWGRAGIIDRLI